MVYKLLLLSDYMSEYTQVNVSCIIYIPTSKFLKAHFSNLCETARTIQSDVGGEKKDN